jgi:hypothetical protein
MTTSISNATREAQQTAERAPERLVERLAERVGGKAHVKAVFGDTIERGELTLVPVARVRWGFGGGDGTGPELAGGARSGSGSGGGGGVAADPVGYLEIGPEGATFRPIVPPYPSPLFLLAAGITAALVLRALARLLRAQPGKQVQVLPGTSTGDVENRRDVNWVGIQ